MKTNATYALYGGSFDPPHLGHQKIVEAVLNLDFIDGVIITPTYINPFKESFHVAAKTRLAWCKKLFCAENIIVSDYEVAQERAVYTIETYKHLKNYYNIKALVIGADNLKSITKWKDFTTLNRELHWIVIRRPNEEADCSALCNYTLIPLDIDVSSSEIRAGKKLEFLDPAIKKQVLKEYNLEKTSEHS